MIFVTSFTDVGSSIIEAIPVKIHLIIDFCAGIFLILSPWIFGFYKDVYTPHIMFGVILIIASITTRHTEPEDLSVYKKVY